MRRRPATHNAVRWLRDYLHRRTGENNFDVAGLDLELVEMRPRDVLVEPGPPIEHVYLVMSGLLRLYVTDTSGNERTLMFYAPDQLIALSSSLQPSWDLYRDDYLKQVIRDRADGDSPFTVEASWSSSVLQLPIEQLFARASADLQWARLAIQEVSIISAILQQQLLDLLLLTREEHYLKIRSEIPELEASIRSRDLSSLLGITPASLSRIRSRLRAEEGENPQDAAD